MSSINYHEWMKKLAAENQERKYDYFIVRHVNNLKYFYLDFDVYLDCEDQDIYKLIWTKAHHLAFAFPTEQQVEEFKAQYISPRKASIIRDNRMPQSLLQLLG